MAVYNDGPTLTLEAAGTIGLYERVKVAAGRKWAQAGVNEKAAGIALQSVTIGQPLTAVLLNRGGTVKMKAGVAISDAVKVYAAASGKIGVAGTSCLEGTSLQAATADGDIIEVLVMPVSIVTL